MSWRFPVWYLFLVSFWVIRCVFPLWGFPQILVLLSYRLSIQPFRYAFSVAIFSSQNCSVSLASSCWYVFVSCPPNCWCNFLSLFWNVLFCLYCFTFCRYLFSLPSFTWTFWFISSSCTVIFSRGIFSILFPHILGSLFPILACFRKFLSGFPVELPILV